MSNSDFDLIVVGGGLSGLATAFYWCSQVDASAKILIIEASSRIGGSSVDHNFKINGHSMAAPGGAQELTFPESFSSIVRSTLTTIGIDLDDLMKNTDFSHYRSRGAKNHAFCFSADQWDRDGIAFWRSEEGIELSDAPLCNEAKSQLSKIFKGEVPWFAGLDETAKLQALQSRSCTEVLTDYGKCHPEVERFFAYWTSPSSGLPFSLHPALDAALVGYPPIGALAPDLPGPWPGLTQAGTKFFNSSSRATYRFPDGNATIARAFLAWLRPDIFHGDTAATRLGETIDFEKLRNPAATRRFHVNETVKAIKPTGEDKVVVETTTSDGLCAKYCGSAVIVATWATECEAIIPALSKEQKTTASAMGRLPIITATVAVSNWRPWEQLGVSSLSWPGHPSWQRAELGFPVKIGAYSPPDSPNKPNTITAIGATTCLHEKPSVAAAMGREFLNQPHQAEKLRDELIRLLECALGPSGFDAQNDIHACQVELWPNGYPCYTTSLDDRDKSVASIEEKKELARGVGRIAIAGADVTDRPFLDSALEAAFDAVSMLHNRITNSNTL
ncbi:NAD(P)-binding protein [Serratia fonticola]|uniref:NAD(P)-binding protein n=1 Tax=Serratia fonticola TaxID=47917 RepID=UPI0015C666DA|nr:NAD(P)-binding protein [Serratia fonticola]MBC3377801.1 NAD(P)-binding protein [Serratia fonticola]NYA37001.1 NAD(P)-binding protein [Serratia fonticola]